MLYEVITLAFRVGILIAKEGCILLSGGRGGVMEAASRGASETGGLVVGIVPGSEGNHYLDVTIRTQMGHARNAIIVESADAIIAVSGSYGTLSEIGVALRIGKPVVITSYSIHYTKLYDPVQLGI